VVIFTGVSGQPIGHIFGSQEVNADKPKYMVLSQDQNAGRSHNVKNDNSSFERVEQFRCFGRTVTNQNYVNEDIKSRLKSVIAC
jgi:hypothetical protein